MDSKYLPHIAKWTESLPVNDEGKSPETIETCSG
jgi:hypothetical protein